MMTSPKSNKAPVEVKMPVYLSIGALEKAMYHVVRPLTKLPVLLDLSPCQYIEMPAMIYLVALLKLRIRKGMPTSLALPIAKNTLDWLQENRFPEAIEAVIGIRLSQFSVGKNARHFDNRPQNIGTKYTSSSIQIGRGREPLLSQYYFPLRTFHSQIRLFNSSFAITEAAKWKHLSSVLRKVLKGPENLFASRIVYEALMNAVRHPAATVIQTGSRLVWPNTKTGKEGHFTITFWDDGLSMIETLKRALYSGKELLSRPIIQTKVRYRIIMQDDYNEPISEGTVVSKRKLRQEDEDHMILLATTFPGISSNPTAHKAHPETHRSAENKELSYPGMGLYLLTNAAVNVYGGKVFVRTGKYRMILSPSADSEDLTVEIRRYRRWPRFPGNLLTVWLPLQFERFNA